MQEGDRHEQARCEGGRNREEGEVNTEKAQRELRKSDKEKAAWGRGGWRAAGKMNGVQASEGPPLSGQRVFLCEIYEAQCGDKKKQRVGTAEFQSKRDRNFKKEERWIQTSVYRIRDLGLVGAASVFTRGHKCVSSLEMWIFGSKLHLDLDVKFETENTVKTRRTLPVTCSQ